MKNNLQHPINCETGELNPPIERAEPSRGAPDARKISQVTIVGLPQPKSWADYRRGALANYGGGHHNDGQLEAFRHGMETVFNLIEAEFPSAEQCKSGHVVLLEAIRRLTEKLRLIQNDDRYMRVWTMAMLHGETYDGPTYESELAEAEAAIKQAERT